MFCGFDLRSISESNDIISKGLEETSKVICIIFRRMKAFTIIIVIDSYNDCIVLTRRGCFVPLQREISKGIRVKKVRLNWIEFFIAEPILD
ncbi:Uncharacterised protein [uncultured archaeon]|nr:Uncharacterised protein [uncultured archaeon]